MIMQVLEIFLRRGDRRSCSRAPSSSLASGSLSATVGEKNEKEQKILQCQDSVAVAGETLAWTPLSSLARQPVHVAPETVHSASCTSRHSGKDEGGEREVRPPRVLSCQDVFGDKEGQSDFDLDTEDEGLFDKKVTTFLREEKVMTFLMDVTDQGKGVGDDTRVQPCGGVIPGDEEATLCQEKATSTGEVSDQGKGVGDDTRAQPCHGMIPGDEGTTFHRFTRRKRRKKR